jgi:hypothetical protein
MLQQPRKPPVPLFNLDEQLALKKEEQQPNLVQQYLQETSGDSLITHLQHVICVFYIIN